MKLQLKTPAIFHFKAILALARLFFKVPEMNDDLKKQYSLFENETLVKDFSLLQLILIGFFSFFFLTDALTIQDHDTYINVITIRTMLIAGIFVPVYIGLKFPFFKKNINFILFVQFVFAGLFLCYTASLIKTIPNIYHKFIALNILLVAVYDIFRIKLKYLFLLSIIQIVLFDLFVFKSELDFKQGVTNQWFQIFFDMNAWFLTITVISFLFNLFIENNVKRNFINNYNLGKQRNELHEANSTKDRFISLIAHDLKNLISSQYVLANMLSQRHKEITEEKRDEFLKLIDNSAYRTIEVLDEIMIWARAQQNRIILRPKEYLIETLIAKNIELLGQTAINKEIDLITEIPQNTRIVIDENCFNTIIRNLIGNAIKFSNRGEKVIIRVTNQNHKIAIQVIDFGTGMTEDTKANLFKVDKMVTTHGTFGEEGSGLGLILCQELARLNHGLIIVESELTKGSTISVVFDQIGL